LLWVQPRAEGVFRVERLDRLNEFCGIHRCLKFNRTSAPCSASVSI